MSGMDDYKEWQDRHDQLNDEAWANHDRDDNDPEKWDTAMDRNHTENMRDATQQERYGREEAREEWTEYGDDNEGHDERIEKLKDREQLYSNKIGHLDGEYEYTTPMQEGNDDVHRELEEENNRRWQLAEEELNEGEEAEEDEEEEEEYENSDMDMDSDNGD